MFFLKNYDKIMQMKKLSNLTGTFEYELLDENQQIIDIREKLALLYFTPFTDILWLELHNPSLKNIGYHKLFYYEQSVLTHIILFKYSTKKGKTIFILNKQFNISVKQIENICRILFCEFDNVQQVIFENVFESNPIQSAKMLIEKTSSDVVILDMPQSMDTYMKSLGASIRKNIKNLSNRIARDFPDFAIHYYENSDISFEQIVKIVSFNRSRMKTKGIISALNDAACKILYQYASASGYGFLCVCTVNGIIISGTINSIIGEHGYLHVIAHDNTYNKYSVGQITLINTIKYLIEKNIKYHHLGGTAEYKFRLGGINHGLYTFRVFRSNNVHYCWGKIVCALRVIYKKFRQRLKANTTIYRLYIKLNKVIIRAFDTC